MVLAIELDEEDDGHWIAETVDIPSAIAHVSIATEAKARAQAIALRVLANRLEHGETSSDLANTPSAA